MATYVTNEGLKNTLNQFLKTLKGWLPFNKIAQSDGSEIVAFPSKEEYKHTLELHSDGKIYILGTNSEPEHLQGSLERKGTTFVDGVDNILKFVTDDNKGRFLYLSNGTSEYPSGLYIVGTDASNHGVPILIRIGTTTGTADIEARLTLVEEWIEAPLSQSDIDILTDDDPSNDYMVGSKQ